MTEDSIRAGDWDSVTERSPGWASVVRVLTEVWTRDIWHAWAGKRTVPTSRSYAEQIERCLSKHGATPSGVLEAFRGIPEHEFFAVTLEQGKPAVDPRIALGVSTKGYAPYDELRELGVAKSRPARKYFTQADEHEAEQWVWAWLKANGHKRTITSVPDALKTNPAPIWARSWAEVGVYTWTDAESWSGSLLGPLSSVTFGGMAAEAVAAFRAMREIGPRELRDLEGASAALDTRIAEAEEALGGAVEQDRQVTASGLARARRRDKTCPEVDGNPCEDPALKTQNSDLNSEHGIASQGHEEATR